MELHMPELHMPKLHAQTCQQPIAATACMLLQAWLQVCTAGNCYTSALQAKIISTMLISTHALPRMSQTSAPNTQMTAAHIHPANTAKWQKPQAKHNTAAACFQLLLMHIASLAFDNSMNKVGPRHRNRHAPVHKYTPKQQQATVWQASLP
jgi:hypothetical protein